MADVDVRLHARMAAFVDEMVMNSAWPHRLVWMGRSLQLQFFGEHLAGEGFFERLSQIRQSGHTQIDLLEVCYWCLQLGFQGKYRLQGEEHLLALKIGLHSQIETARGHIDQRLALIGLPEEGVVKQISREIPFWVIGVITIASIFFVYFIYSMAIDEQTKKALQQIQHSLALAEDR